MHRLSVEEIIERIHSGDCFEAVSADYSFTLKVEDYVPFICGAVHDGHQFRPSLWENCTHSEYERWYEEDPCTKEMVQTFPIVISGRDSRFEYDLNREPERAVYEDAWGKELWKEPLHSAEKKLSLQKHAAFYSVVNALVQKLESQFQNVIVFDMHSYNWKRWDREVPVWNLGTRNINNEKFGQLAESWRKKLESMKLPNGISSTSKINDTFEGNGFFFEIHYSKFR